VLASTDLSWALVLPSQPAHCWEEQDRYPHAFGCTKDMHVPAQTLVHLLPFPTLVKLART